MKKKKLLLLAEELEAEAERGKINFDLADWGSAKVQDGKLVLNCQTQACAVGLACLNPKFKRLTYHINTYEGSRPINGEYVTFYPKYKNKNGVIVEEPVQKYFGLKPKEEYLLFMPGAYEDTKGDALAVASRIRRFLKGMLTNKEKKIMKTCHYG